MLEDSPTAVLQRGPKQQVSLRRSYFCGLHIIRSECSNANVGLVSRPRHRAAIVRLQRASAIVVSQAEDAPLTRISPRELPRVRAVQDVYIEFAITIHLEDAAGGTSHHKIDVRLPF